MKTLIIIAFLATFIIGCVNTPTKEYKAPSYTIKQLIKQDTSHYQKHYINSNRCSAEVELK